MTLRVIALCIAAAMICSALRTQRPEMAMVVSLAAGLTAVALLAREFASAPDWLGAFSALSQGNRDLAAAVLKAACIAVVAELASQLCADSGERALAGRIALASRVAVLSVCAPMLAEMAGTVGALFG